MEYINQLLDSGIETLVIGVIIFIVFFLIIREVIMWYWKINKRLKKQERQIELLEDILEELKKR